MPVGRYAGPGRASVGPQPMTGSPYGEIQLPRLPGPSNLQASNVTYGSDGGYSASYAPMVQAGEWSPTGYGSPTTLTRPAYETQQQTQLEADLARKRAEHNAQLLTSQRADALKGFQTMMPPPGGPAAPGGADPNMEQFEALQYGRAKDRIGQQRLSALKSFQDVMHARGMAGSTDDAAGAGEILAGANDDLADVVLNQATGQVSRRRQVEDRNFDAAEAYRRQVLSSLGSLFGSSGSLY
jgi:hypothetical protein